MAPARCCNDCSNCSQQTVGSIRCAADTRSLEARAVIARSWGLGHLRVGSAVGLNFPSRIMLSSL
jgi:hypothetical protein